MKDGLDDKVAVQVNPSKDDLFLKNTTWQTHATFMDCFWTGQLPVHMFSAHFLCILYSIISSIINSILMIFLSKELTKTEKFYSVQLQGFFSFSFFSQFNIFKTFQYPFEQLC